MSIRNVWAALSPRPPGPFCSARAVYVRSASAVVGATLQWPPSPTVAVRLSVGGSAATEPSYTLTVTFPGSPVPANTGVTSFVTTPWAG